MASNARRQNIPSGWKFGELGNFLVDIGDGGTPLRSRDEYFGGNIPWVVVNDIKPHIKQTKDTLTDKGLQKSSAKLWPTGSVILSFGATIGEVGIADVPVTTKQGIAGIIPNDDLLNTYLYYLLLSKKNLLHKLSSGSTIKEVRPSVIKTQIKVLIPPTKEQKKIAEILGTVDEDITKTQEVIVATEKLKRGLMQQLFTRGIGHTKFKETKVGQIPEEWEVSRIDKYIDSLDAGVSVNSRDVQKSKDEIGILKTSAVTFGVFDPKQHKVVINEECNRVAVPVKANRLIVSRMNTRELVGANAYVPENYSDLFLPDRLWQVEPKDERKISMLWLSYVFGSLWKNGFFAELATGTSASMKNLSKNLIMGLEIAFPNIDEQKEIAEILSAVDEKISVNKKLKEKLTFLKKGLMQDLLSGKVRTI